MDLVAVIEDLLAAGTGGLGMLLQEGHGLPQLGLAVLAALDHGEHVGGDHHVRQLLGLGGALVRLIDGVGIVAVGHLAAGHQDADTVDLTNIKAAQFHSRSPFF